jgi:hypothetical protein
MLAGLIMNGMKFDPSIGVIFQAHEDKVASNFYEFQSDVLKTP